MPIPPNKPRGGDDDLEEDDDGFTKRDAYRAMWIFYWICFTGWCLTGGPVLVISLFWICGHQPCSSNKVQPEAPRRRRAAPRHPTLPPPVGAVDVGVESRERGV